MRMDVPGRIERAVVKASDIDLTAESQEDTAREEFRDDSPFAQSKPETDTATIEDTVQWLHDQGYRFKDIYGLLLGEIETLSDGFERKQQRQKDAQSSDGSQRTATAYGNKGDRAQQLGWR